MFAENDWKRTAKHLEEMKAKYPVSSSLDRLTLLAQQVGILAGAIDSKSVYEALGMDPLFAKNARRP